MHAIHLYNTLGRTVEKFRPLVQGKVKLYSCGPTVYDYVHIGNLRTYTMNDVLVRTLRYFGYDVTFIQNITDFGHLVGDGNEGDDKLAVGANRVGRTVEEIADLYTKAYENDAKSMNLLPPTQWVRASHHIEDQRKMIQALIEKDFAYPTEMGIYFDTGRLESYGDLALLNKKGMLEGARVEANPQKRNPADFVLWKLTEKSTSKRSGQWDSAWGVGFPGWHIECSAMSTKYLGDRFDIHTGGVDHVPLHHTNERAQNIATFGHPVVSYWIHGSFLKIDSGRMGKSEGNAYTLSDLALKSFSPLDYRYFTYSAHYRSPLNFTWEALAAAKSAYRKLRNRTSASAGNGTPHSGYLTRFEVAIESDLNMPEAIAVLWELVKDESVSEGEKIRTVEKMDEVLGLDLLVPPAITAVPAEIMALAERRLEARKKRDWAEADRLREELTQAGWSVRDEETTFTLTQAEDLPSS